MDCLGSAEAEEHVLLQSASDANILDRDDYITKILRRTAQEKSTDSLPIVDILASFADAMRGKDLLFSTSSEENSGQDEVPPGRVGEASADRKKKKKKKRLTNQSASLWNEEGLFNPICSDYLNGVCSNKRWRCKFAHPPMHLFRMMIRTMPSNGVWDMKEIQRIARMEEKVAETEAPELGEERKNIEIPEPDVSQSQIFKTESSELTYSELHAVHSCMQYYPDILNLTSNGLIELFTALLKLKTCASKTAIRCY